MSISCDIKQVIEVLGMTPAKRSEYELRFGRKGSLSVNLKSNTWYDHEQQDGGGMLDLIIHKGMAKNRSEAAGWLKQRDLLANDASPPSKKPILREHVYRNDKGELVRKAVKYEDGSWRQFKWQEGDWIANVTGVPNIPYQLPELLEDNRDRPVYIMEGEKDVDRAIKFGLLATCNVGGAGKWTRELNQYLVGKKVCIVPDNDDAGARHADKTLQILAEDAIDAHILTSHLKELPNKGDFSDWMDANDNDVDSFIKLAERDIKNEKTPEQAYLEKFGIMPASQLLERDFEPLSFLYEGLIPSIGLTLIAALPKTGKSFFVLNLAAHMDTAGIKVHYLAAEDNERRLKDRVQLTFSDRPNHLTYHAVMSSEHSLPRGEDALFYIEQVAKGTNAQCVIIDTVQAILNPSATNKNYDTTVEEYGNLRKLAHRLKIAIIVVHHCKKSSDIASAPLEKVIGSIGITGTAETILVMEQLTGKRDCKLHVTGKDVEQCEKYLTWNGGGFSIDDDVREAMLGATQKLIYQLIQDSPRCTQKHIVDTIGRDQGQVAKAIDRLVELGLVVKSAGRLIAQ